MAPSPPRDPASELLPELLRAVIDNLPISVGPGGGALEVFSDVDSAGS